MHISNTVALAALPFFAAATPITSRQTAPQPTVYGISAISTNNGNYITSKAVVAANQSFYFSHSASSSLCGSDGALIACDKPTQIFVQLGLATLSTSVQGGQPLYISSTGALSYMPAHHTGPLPPGASPTGFSVASASTTSNDDTDPSSSPMTNLLFAGAALPSIWLACPTTAEASRYQIFADVPGLQQPTADVKCQTVILGLGLGNATKSPFAFG